MKTGEGERLEEKEQKVRVFYFENALSTGSISAGRAYEA